MATYTRQIVGALGSGKTGLTGSVGYTVVSTGGTTLVARTTSGVAELGSTGTYYASVSWDTSWSGRIVWDVSATDQAAEEFLPTNNVVLDATGLDSVVVETGVNARQALSVIGSAVAAVLSGVGTSTITIKGMGNNTTRITATVDNSGNRTAVSLSPPA